MDEQKWKQVDLDELDEIHEQRRQWIGKLLDQNRKIIEQNDKLVQNNVMMLEKLQKPAGIISIDPAAEEDTKNNQS